ncbi:T9SS type A sorting domain-containing protein [Epilithonimonas sp.]|uniref:T9SS type A sorting domain-containing protein n=1 Tax=Epilithonimonas sp. TaxID=2894511 RepID=UPI0028A1C544|nr:T9SS type A sorting domain-containing protein [Epilithonimonas sp.]
MKKLYFLTLLGYATSFFGQATVPPYTQEFTTFPLTNWYLGYAFNANVGNGPTNTSTNYWQQKPFLGNTSANDPSLCINLFTANVSAWAITNAFDLSGGDYEISFDYATANGPFMTNPNGPAPQVESTDKFKILITPDNGTTWQELESWDNPNMTISNERNTITIDVSAYKGNNVKFAFYASDGTTFVAAANYRIFVDNFKVQAKQIMAASDITKSNTFQVYPNPTVDKVSVRTEKIVKEIGLYDSTGRKLQSTTSKMLDLSKYSKGIYHLKINFSDSTMATQKVVKL